jgi:antitoxin component YwqK of YwqJK toxin-antitoxin module
MTKDIVNENERGEYHGIQIGYHGNGQIAYKDYYINGNRHGIQIGYYADNPGQLWYKIYYINGVLVSPEEYLAYERRSKLDIIKDL